MDLADSQRSRFDRTEVLWNIITGHWGWKDQSSPAYRRAVADLTEFAWQEFNAAAADPDKFRGSSRAGDAIRYMFECGKREEVLAAFRQYANHWEGGVKYRWPYYGYEWAVEAGIILPRKQKRLR